MTKMKVGLKVYSNDWYLKYNLSYTEAADLLCDWGVNFIIAQSKVLPMPDTAVKSELSPEYAERYSSYDDVKFRKALADNEIEYWATTLFFMDRDALEKNTLYKAFGSDGNPMDQIDWYEGIPPTMQKHVDHKCKLYKEAVRILQPDGIHFGFMRWPQFWELWMPEHKREDFIEYSYDKVSLTQFQEERNIALPSLDPLQAAQWINKHARDEWTDWKCDVVYNVIKQVKNACSANKVDIRASLNTIPFGRADYENAVEEVYGQSFEKLSDVIDMFEVMTYHQILKRPIDWIASIGKEVRSRSGKTTVCTLQGNPLYIDGMHTSYKRKRTIDIEEFESAVEVVVNETSIDGIVLFTWADLLKHVFEDHDSRKVDILKAAARARR